MIDALIQGHLHGAPQSRTAKNGSPFTTATVRVPTRDGGTLFASVICFSATACQMLLALKDGDSLALAGEATLKLYQPKNGGEPRPSLDLLAHAVLSPYHVKRRRDAVAESRAHERAQPAAMRSEPAGATAKGFDDEIPF